MFDYVVLLIALLGVVGSAYCLANVIAPLIEKLVNRFRKPVARPFVPTHEFIEERIGVDYQPELLMDLTDRTWVAKLRSLPKKEMHRLVKEEIHLRCIRLGLE